MRKRIRLHSHQIVIDGRNERERIQLKSLTNKKSLQEGDELNEVILIQDVEKNL